MVSPVIRTAKVLSKAKFSKDMIETLHKNFDQYEDGGELTLVVTDKGILIQIADGVNLFLGSTTKIVDAQPHHIASPKLA